MSNQFSPVTNGSVTVFIYEDELDFLKWLVLQKPDIETGGDLFGLWQDESTAVVQLILGPGEKCRRTTTSFYQDVSYLREVGAFLTSSQGLCNIGEWHSHHTLGLAQPSYGDQQTVWDHISSMAGRRFLVFIANITGTPPMVNIGCFLFNWSQQKMLTGNIKCLPCPSPVRMTVNTTNITSKAERTQDWKTFMKYQVSMQKNSEPIVTRSTPKDGKGVLNKFKQNRTKKSRKGQANIASKDPLLTAETIEVSNSLRGGDGISSTSSTRNGSQGLDADNLNAENSQADTEERETTSTAPRNGNCISHSSGTRNGIGNTSNNGHSSSPTTKDDNAILSTHNSNQDAATTVKNRKPNKKGNQVKKHNTSSNAKKSKSSKKSKKAGKMKKRDKQKEIDENYGEEDALLIVDENDEQELSKCGKFFKRFREICKNMRNFLAQKICGCH